MDIIVARIVTGDIVVGKKTAIGIEKCIALRIVQKSPTQIETHVMPLLHPFSDEFIDIDYDKIVFSAKASKELSTQYIQSTSTIEIVPNVDLSKINSNITPFAPRRK